MVGYLADGDVAEYEVLDGDCLAFDGDVLGSIDIRSIKPLKRSRSTSAWPPELPARSCSI